MAKNTSSAFNNTALIVVDVMESFCKASAMGNEDTERVAKRIAKRLSLFRDAGMPIYAVYSSKYGSDTPNIYEADFYKIDIKDTDHLICKSDHSAFFKTDLLDQMTHDGIENVLICGVNYSVCVYQTALDAMENYFETVILQDLTADGEDFNTQQFPSAVAERTMKANGATHLKSKEIIKTFKNTM